MQRNRHQINRTAAILTLALMALAPSAALAAAPHWCGNASGATQGLICTTPELWPLDACEDELFNELFDPAVERAESEWVSARDGCGGDLACVRMVYKRRIGELERTAGRECRAYPSEEAATAPDTPDVVPEADERPSSEPDPFAWCKEDASCRAVAGMLSILGEAAKAEREERENGGGEPEERPPSSDMCSTPGVYCPPGY